MADNIIYRPNNKENMKLNALICDLDGTLCNISHRRHFVQNKPYDWPEFYAKMVHDTPNEWCLSIVRQVIHLNLIFVTGRPDEYKEPTIAWLKKFITLPYLLFMRKSGDYRDDATVKEEIYWQNIKPDYNVQFVLDDRNKVVEMWRRNGLVCLQCDEGDF